MADKFLEIAFTDSVCAAQARYYGKAQGPRVVPERDVLTEEEIQFIRARDSFYLATVNPSGWPFIQHRGGEPGFLQVPSPTSLAFVDYRGNRQLLSAGNLTASDRICLFLMDYPQRTRLKILGQAQVVDAREHPELVAKFAPAADRHLVERVFLIEVVAFDWNCPKHITPRYTEAEIAALIAPLKQRIAELEARLNADP